MALRPSGVATELLLGGLSQKDVAGVLAAIPCSAWNGDMPVSESGVVFHKCASSGT